MTQRQRPRASTSAWATSFNTRHLLGLCTSKTDRIRPCCLNSRLASSRSKYLTTVFVTILTNLSGFRADDLALLKWGYKRNREFARRMTCYRGEYVPNHPQFATTSLALCQSEIKPVAIDAPDIQYTEDDEKAIETYIRKIGVWLMLYLDFSCSIDLCEVATAWHSVSQSDRLSPQASHRIKFLVGHLCHEAS